MLYFMVDCVMLNCEQCQTSSQSAMGECTKCAGVFVLDKGTCNDSKLMKKHFIYLFICTSIN